MAADGRIVIDVELNDGSVVQGTADITRQLNRMGDNSESVFKKLGNGFKSLATVAAVGVGAVAGVGAAVVGLAKPLVEAAAATQALNSQFSQVFGDLETQATDALNKIGEETSILPDRLKGSFTMMAAFAKTTGMESSKALDLTSRATLAAADSAAFYDKSIEEVSENLQSFLKGNYENDAALGISATEFTRNAAAADLFGKKFKDLTEEQKQFTLLDMVEQGNKLSGAMGQASREGDGLENVVGNLKQAWENLKVKLGEPILEPAIAALKWLTEILSDFDVTPFINVFNSLQTIVADVFNNIKTYVQTSIDTIRDVWSTHGTSIIDAVKNIFESIKTTVLPILDGAFDTIKNVIGNVKTVWETDGQAIIERLSGIFESIKSIVVPIVQGAVDLIVEYFAKVKEFWDTNGAQILQAVSNVFNGILTFIEFVMPAVQFVVEYVWNAIKNIFTGALDVIMGAVKIFSGLFTGDWSKMWEGIKQTLSGAIDLILGIMSLSFVGGIRTALTNLAKTAINLIKGKWTSIVNLFKTQSANALTTVTNMVKSILNFFKNLATNTVNTIRNMGSNTVTAIKTMGTNMINAIKSLPGKFIQIGKDIMQGLINGIKGMGANVMGAIGNVVDGLVNKATSLLGIHSPSRVFKQIGLWTGEGLAIGLNSSSKMVNEAMSNIGDGILAVSDAYQKEYSDLIDEFNRKNEDKNEATLEKIYKIRNAAAKKKRKLTKKELQDIALLEAQYKDAKLQAEKDFDKKYVALVKKSEKEYLDVIKTYIDDKKSLDELSLIQEAAIWEQSIELFAEGSKERTTAQQNYKKSVEAVNKEVVAINKQYQDEMQRISDDLIRQENELTKAYDDAVKNRRNSLMNFAGTFDEFKIEITQTGTELLANLNSQVDGFKKWQAEFAKLSSRGVDSELLDELSDLGVKALPQLMALNQLTDDQLTQYSALYQEKSQLARKQAETELAGMKADTDKQIKELRSVANKQLIALKNEWVSKIQDLTATTSSELSSLEQVGKDAGRGLLNGLASMEGPLAAKAKQIANSIKSSIQQALDIHSPSRWMRDFVAGNLAKGFEVGVDKNEGMLKNAAVQIGEFIKPTIINPLRGAKLNLGLDKPAASTSNISNIYNNNNYGKGGVPTIEPAPVILDGQKIGEVVFNTVTRKQAGTNALTAYMRGV